MAAIPAQPILDPQPQLSSDNPQVASHTATQDGAAIPSSTDLDVIVGPLINFRRLSNELSETPTWHGSVLLVTTPTSPQPTLRLSKVDTAEGSAQASTSSETTVAGEKLYQDPGKSFWRFWLELPIAENESFWQYSFTQSSNVEPKVFTIPAKSQSMRILFHSCNGFSVGTDEDAWHGPALWNDVVRVHKEKPFHIMIGGGDQIYNDNVRVTGPLQEWTAISNPRKRREYQFTEDLRQRCDEHYYQNYIKWYGTEPFKHANCIIPQVNIWDDHDIIDGFGSYTDKFMKCHVFRGIGGVAHKYYLLFQHHLAPPKVTFTSDAATSEHEGGTDPIQSKDTFVLEEKANEPQYIIGSKPGPYVEERSRSIFTQLGARIGFLGIDARLERTRHQVNYPETYDQIFNRLDEEYGRNKNLKHLILLLGVPIAYPRLIWLENIFSSPIIGPIRFLNKRFGFAGGLFNKFDGQVDLLDDLDDHYTARSHKTERRELLQKLQAFSKKHSARVTILGGDVHLAAIGRFYSNPKLKIPAENDWRYMPNIISSAITNKPPPAAVANILAKRNKIHHLDHDTDETLLEFFNHDPGMGVKKELETNPGEASGPIAIKKKTSDSNKVTMPSRNYAIIEEADGVGAPETAPEITPAVLHPDTNGTNGSAPTNGVAHTGSWHPSIETSKYNMRKPIHDGEKNAGTEHAAADGVGLSGIRGGLDVTIRVEISNKDAEGRTEGYAFTIPSLSTEAYSQQGKAW